jgi:hypothetical protein
MCPSPTIPHSYQSHTHMAKSFVVTHHRSCSYIQSARRNSRLTLGNSPLGRASGWAIAGLYGVLVWRGKFDVSKLLAFAGSYLVRGIAT